MLLQLISVQLTKDSERLVAQKQCLLFAENYISIVYMWLKSNVEIDISKYFKINSDSCLIFFILPGKDLVYDARRQSHAQGVWWTRHMVLMC